MTDETTSPIIEAYCMRCKTRVDMEDPEAVWTSRSHPGTRGTCPVCGGTVFRMGATHLHEGMTRPEAIVIQKHPRRQKPKIEPNTVYINYAEADEDTAQQLAADLNKVGLTTWLHTPAEDNVRWAGGVHPALKDTARMVYLLSEDTLDDATIREAWTFFRDKRKPVVIAQLGATSPPDALRRSPRFNLDDDYKSAFRQIVQTLAR